MTFHIDFAKTIAGLWLLAMWLNILPMTLTAVTVVIVVSMCEIKMEWS